MNKYLEKIASFDEVARGSFSPAWMESHIAQKHGKKSPDGFVENAKIHLKGNWRASGRSLAEGIAGGVAGAGLGAGVAKLMKKDPRTAAVLTGLGGLYAGTIHGPLKSLSNQAKEMNKKYKD